MILEQKMMGKTIILTTHNMHDAEELCDRVAFIVDGKIKALDTPRALRKSNSGVKVEYSFANDGREIQKDCLITELGMSKDFQTALKMSTLLSIHSKEQTLEDVFITLTGSHLQ